jgi:hypothetical protein
MKIMIGIGASEPEYTTGKCLIRAFKRAGHEVCTIGAVYGRSDTSIWDQDRADIDLPDKPYPETYTYDEVIAMAPWRPNLILQIEPHFYLVGKKPAGIRSAYWVLDPHRGGLGHRDMAWHGHFDAVFITQKWFAESYVLRGMSLFWLPQAVDSERIKHDPSIKPECDIAFVGETGVDMTGITYDRVDLDGFRYMTKFSQPIKFRSEHEYHERAVMIDKLSNDFNVRIYEKQTGENYAKIIQKGMMGFHRSLNNDIAIRLFEVMACKRPLVCDHVPHLEELMQPTNHAFFYKQFGYSADLPNFQLEYEMARLMVSRLIEDTNVRDAIAGMGWRFVLEHHTYDVRVKTILGVISALDKKTMG